MIEITIDETVESKQVVDLCRANADGTLTVIGRQRMSVTTSFSSNEQTATYRGKTYQVKGTIYKSYIVIA